MHRLSLQHLGILMALASVAGALWAGQWYARGAVATLHDEQLAARETALKAVDEQSMLALARSSAAETAAPRARIDAAAHADIVSAAALIESAGKGTGASIRVTDVAPGTDRDAKLAALTGVHAVMFSVESSGTFAQVFAVLSRLEVLPIPVQLEQLALVVDQSGKAGARWQLKVRLRLLTAASAT